MIEKLQSLDLFILHALNSLCGVNWFFDHAAGLLESNNLVKLAPFMVVFWAVWFTAQNQNQNREKLILLLLAVVIALVANRTSSELMPFRPRPIFVPDIGIRHSLRETPFEENLDHFSSFPSDHAALLFSMAAGFWLISRPIGMILSAWAICVAASRVYFGIHFPSDIVVGSLLGIGAAVIANRSSVFMSLARSAVAAEHRAAPYFYGAIFLFTFEINTLFTDFRALASGALRVFRHIV